jgi:hypothetical protein
MREDRASVIGWENGEADFRSWQNIYGLSVLISSLSILFYFPP